MAGTEAYCLRSFHWSLLILTLTFDWLCGLKKKKRLTDSDSTQLLEWTIVFMAIISEQVSPVLHWVSIVNIREPILILFIGVDFVHRGCCMWPIRGAETWASVPASKVPKFNLMKGQVLSRSEHVESVERVLITAPCSSDAVFVHADEKRVRASEDA